MPDKVTNPRYAGRNLNNIDKMMITIMMLKQGILPMEDVHLDMRRGLQQMTPDDARTFKRKFRKLWRKALRDLLNKKIKLRSTGDPPKRLVGLIDPAASVGIGKKVPSRNERNARKALVFDMMWDEIIGPFIENMKVPGAGK